MTLRQSCVHGLVFRPSSHPWSAVWVLTRCAVCIPCFTSKQQVCYKMWRGFFHLSAVFDCLYFKFYQTNTSTLHWNVASLALHLLVFQLLNFNTAVKCGFISFTFPCFPVIELQHCTERGFVSFMSPASQQQTPPPAGQKNTFTQRAITDQLYSALTDGSPQLAVPSQQSRRYIFLFF